MGQKSFSRKSFTIVALTGVGKTTFGLVMSYFFKTKVLIVVSTKLLGKQFQIKIEEFLKRMKFAKKVLFYEPKKVIKKVFEERKFDIFICTNAFFIKKFAD